jgi:hypothetical protein
MIYERTLKTERIETILFLVVMLVFIYFYTSTESEQIVKGSVIDFGADVSELGIHSFLLVKLDDNNTVKVNYNNASKLDIGKKALMSEKITKLFGAKKYKLTKLNKNL